MTKYFFLTLLALTSLVAPSVHANLSTDPDMPITHCYHWLENPGTYLAFKIDHAQKNRGELSFFASGGVAGSGLYCGKTPLDSYTYGDALIRVEFIKDVVIYNKAVGGYYCGRKGLSSTCDKPIDVTLYDTSSHWYVIHNQNAVRKWAVNSAQAIEDLQNTIDHDKAHPAYLGGIPKLKQTLQNMKTSAVVQFSNSKRRGFRTDLDGDELEMINLKILSAKYADKDLTQNLVKHCGDDVACTARIANFVSKKDKKNDRFDISYECVSTKGSQSFQQSVERDAQLNQIQIDCNLETNFQARIIPGIKIKNVKITDTRNGFNMDVVKKLVKAECEGQETCNFNFAKKIKTKEDRVSGQIFVDYECSPDLNHRGKQRYGEYFAVSWGDPSGSDLKLSCKGN